MKTMDNKEFARDLEAWTRRFALSVIRRLGKLLKSIESKVMRNQLTKAGASVGANYRAANRSRSKADFKSRISLTLGTLGILVHFRHCLHFGHFRHFSAL
jgi:hypothetical protein